MIEVAIPHAFISLSKDSHEPGRLFKKYVAGYVRHSYPGYQLKRIEKMTAIIERRQ
ncbi:hypothetical protein SAMN04488081_0840 [Salimicrobium album]|uniref:Uncharacterized protein n=1 Tax=Salimicrobium album TaxID=50717 RepID=A0A1H3D5Q6_9BACI|nr:hypothetical protein SAMN04488081_0840 [Salimicrobium album]